jgi:lysophospholipase L1-like esterase
MLNTAGGVSSSHLCRRMRTSLFLACILLFTAVPVALASPTSSHASSLAGPKKYYLALGDSLAFGYQPDLDFDDGYTHDLFIHLRTRGVKVQANLGCPRETSTTLIHGKCPVPYLRKFPYTGAQLNAALAYLYLLRGQVSPVTLDIGINDLLPNINTSTCTINDAQFNADLATLDANLTQTILPQLQAALTVDGALTGDLVLMNYYDPYQHICPHTVPYVQTLNQHLAEDASSSGARIADVFAAFGGTSSPNLCAYTWICSAFKDTHARAKGYSIIATAFEDALGY